jgi:hypothetical protein
MVGSQSRTPSIFQKAQGNTFADSPYLNLGGNGKHEENGEADVPLYRLLCFQDIEVQKIVWLWEGRVAFHTVTVLDGDPGLGKSTLSIDLAARISRGWCMPPDAGKEVVSTPGGVLILAAEDSSSRIIKPRLLAAGADVSRIHFLSAIVTAEDDERPPILPFDLAALEHAIVTHGIKLVIVDPFMAFLDGKIDSHKDQDVRRCMARLIALAEKTGAAILLIRHLNKMPGGPAIYRGGGSIGIGASGRSVLVVGGHPNLKGEFVLAAGKVNLGAMPASLSYAIESATDSSRIKWGVEVDYTADDILAVRPEPKKKVGDQSAQAIRDLLAAGPMPVARFDEEMAKLGYSAATIKRARAIVKPHSWAQGFGKDCVWMIGLRKDEAPVGGEEE